MTKLAVRTIGWTEAGLVPDRAIRAGIRRLLTRRLQEIQADDVDAATAALQQFLTEMRSANIALLPDTANQQHYEVPAEFFTTVLGRHNKYSCCHWPESVSNLDEAESSALELTCRRANIVDGMTVLDLGCGWGSLSLWIAQRYPDCVVTAISNSVAQRHHIETQAQKLGLDNIAVLTRDMNEFEAPGRYDRIVSVEMFEHMRNWEVLFQRVSRWLTPEGRFFMHIFCHRLCAYPFVDNGASDWMSRYFFTGGMMPSANLPSYFQNDLRLDEQWFLDGRHYEKTANAWLANLDANRDRILPLFAATYGAEASRLWLQRWRMFFMACAELFGRNEGQEWYVGHYLFSPRSTS